jgi:hypothetical protein
VTCLPMHYKIMSKVNRRHVTSLPYALLENELSKPETCDLSTLYTTSPVYLVHSLVVSRVEKSDISGLLSSFSCSA